VDVVPGTVLLGKYRVDDVLGIGGMGKVVLAWHLQLEQWVAIKALLPHVADNPATVQRFVREAQATVRLRSEHIARVMDVGTLDDGTPIMVMEYLEGDDLNQIVRAHGPQDPHVVVDLMLQACEGIAEAHAAGIIHRDIKPSNFFITRRVDGSQLLKILDFGISKSPVGANELTSTQTVVGTPSYMAPEQMKAARNADARSDVWSMGVVMYQLIAGRPPFGGDSYAELVLSVTGDPPQPLQIALPGGLANVIWACLEKSPMQRIQSVAELAKQIAPYSTDPHSGALAADRTNRILLARSSMPRDRLRSEGGSVVPTPLSRSSLTPATWQQQVQQGTQNSSLSNGVGQVSEKQSGKRGWFVAGGLLVAVLAGGGGWFASGLSRKQGIATPAAVEQTLAATVDAGVIAPVPDAAVPIDAAVADAALPKAVPAPVDAAVPDAAVPPDAAVKPKRHPHGGGTTDLFDSRH
jgi:serine/threonine-protein kinase